MYRLMMLFIDSALWVEQAPAEKHNFVKHFAIICFLL
jgi:hypothetical protein